MFGAQTVALGSAGDSTATKGVPRSVFSSLVWFVLFCGAYTRYPFSRFSQREGFSLCVSCCELACGEELSGRVEVAGMPGGQRSAPFVGCSPCSSSYMLGALVLVSLAGSVATARNFSVSSRVMAANAKGVSIGCPDR